MKDGTTMWAQVAQGSTPLARMSATPRVTGQTGYNPDQPSDGSDTETECGSYYSGQSSTDDEKHPSETGSNPDHSSFMPFIIQI